MEDSFSLSLRLLWEVLPGWHLGQAACRGLPWLSAASHCSSVVAVPQLLVREGREGPVLLAVCVPSLPRVGVSSVTLSRTNEGVVL